MRAFCRAGALASGALPKAGRQSGHWSACPATTLRHSENPTAYGKSGVSEGWVAQSAEQWTENPRVGGSIPPPAIALKIRRLQQILQQNIAMRECISCGRTLLKLVDWLREGLPAR